jgi:hypothetical protein
MFPLLFLVDDSRIVDRYFSLSVGVDMSLSLVSFFSRQAAAKERKEKCNRSKLSKASRCFVCLYQRTTKRKEREKNSSSSSSICLPVAHRIMVVIVCDVYLSSSCVYLLFKSETKREKESSKTGTKSSDFFFIDNNYFLVCKNYLFVFCLVILINGRKYQFDFLSLYKIFQLFSLSADTLICLIYIFVELKYEWLGRR